MEERLLFRVIDVHLSDDGSPDVSLLSSRSSLKGRQHDEDEEAFVVRHDASASQMLELGLPTCFSSTSRRAGFRRSRRPRRQSLSHQEVTCSLDDEFSEKLCAVVNESFVQSPLKVSSIDSLQVSLEGSLEDDGTSVSKYEAIGAPSRDQQEDIELDAGDRTNRCSVCNDEASHLACGVVVDGTSLLAPDVADGTAIDRVGSMLNIREPLVAQFSDDAGMAGSTEVVLNDGDVALGEQVMVSETASKDESPIEAMLRVSRRDKEDVFTVSNGVAGVEDEETMCLNGSNLRGVDAGAMANSASCKGEHVDNVLVELVNNSQILPSPDIARWSACWDDYYGRYYFYNMETLETTWEPPMGFESCAYISTVEDSNELLQDGALNGISNGAAKECKEGEVQKSAGLLHAALGEEVGSCLASVQSKFSDVYDSEVPHKEGETEGDQEHLVESSLCQEITTLASDESSNIHVEVATCKVSVPTTRRGKKAASLLVRLERNGTDIAAAMVDHSPSILKYWVQRFRLFTKYDSGVKLDEEGWFSVTPEAIAKHQAARCKSGVIVDAFTGVGGNAIQFALAGHYVVAIDNDPKKIEYAHNNATVYGVASRIDFVLGDFFAVSSSIQADVVFLSPPWGGPDYLDVKVYDILTMLQPKDGVSLFKAAQGIAPNIIFFLPRNVDMNQLAELSKMSSSPCSCEVERNFLNGKLKAVTAYYGQFASMEETCS